MLYLSSYLGRPVLDAASRRVGKVRDLVARFESRFPPIVALRVATGRRSSLDVPWQEVRSFEPTQLILARPGDRLPRHHLEERDVLLARNVLDKQIIDLEGRRLIRVQDIQLSRVFDHLRVLAVDVSASALLRRLHWYRLAEWIAARYPPHAVPWTDVDLGSWRDPNVRLRVSRSGLRRLHPADLAEIAATLPLQDRADLLASLGKEVAADTLQEMGPEMQVELLEALGPERASQLFQEMSPDEAADLLQTLPAEGVATLLTGMDPKDASRLRSLLHYEEESAGGLMTTEVLTAGVQETAQEVVERLRRGREDLPEEGAHQAYVVDDSRRLIGELTLRDLVLAPPDASVRSLMRASPVSVGPDASKDDVIEAFAKYRLLALPVEDEDGHLLGAVTVDDALGLLVPRARTEQRRLLG